MVDSWGREEGGWLLSNVYTCFPTVHIPKVIIIIIIIIIIILIYRHLSTKNTHVGINGIGSKEKGVVGEEEEEEEREESKANDQSMNLA